MLHKNVRYKLYKSTKNKCEKMKMIDKMVEKIYIMPIETKRNKIKRERKKE